MASDCSCLYLFRCCHSGVAAFCRKDRLTRPAARRYAASCLWVSTCNGSFNTGYCSWKEEGELLVPQNVPHCQGVVDCGCYGYRIHCSKLGRRGGNRSPISRPLSASVHPV